MSSFEHLTIQARDVKANILAIGTANNAVPGQWYLATNTNEYFFGAQDGSLVGPIIPSTSQFIQSISDTDSIDLDVTTNELTANLRLDPAGDNLLSASAAGVYAKEYTIHPDSQPYLEITANNEIKTKQLLVTDTTVDTTETSLADYLTTAGYNSGNLIHDEGDIIILTQINATYIHNGGAAGTTADFTEISADVTDSYIRNLFSGVDGISYNNSTGVFSLDQSYTRGLLSATSPLSYNATTGDFSIDTNGISNSLIRQSVGTSVIGRAANSTGDVADIQAPTNDQFLVRRFNSLQFDNLSQGDVEVAGAITTASNGLTKVGNDIKLGGILSEDTIINGDHLMKFDIRSLILATGEISLEKEIILPSTGTGGNKVNYIEFDGNNFQTSGSGNRMFLEINVCTESGGSNFIQKYFYAAYWASLGNSYYFLNGLDFETENMKLGHIEQSGTIFKIPVYYKHFESRNLILRIKIISGGVSIQNRLDCLKNCSAGSSWASQSYPTFKLSNNIHSNLLIGADLEEFGEYELQVNGDTRITSGLWVGGGSPPADLDDGTITAVNGYRVNNTAPSGNYLRGNGTNFIASALLASDLNGIVAVANGGTGLGSLGTAGQILKVNAGGTALEYADEANANPYTFQNGLTETALTVELGGNLTKNTTIGLDTYNLFITRSTGKVTFFDTTAGPSGFNIYDQDLEIISANPATLQRGIVLEREDGTRVKAVVGNNNQWVIEPI